LEFGTREFSVAINADEGAEVAVEFDGWDVRVGKGVEGVDVCTRDEV
jgi:hypothetical protein